MEYIIYSLILGLFSFLHSIPTAKTAFVPLGRDSAGAVLVNTSIWVFGGCILDMGVSNNYLATNNLYSLDVSQSWPSSSPLWTDYSGSLPVTPQVSLRCPAALATGADGVSLWIYGSVSNFTLYNISTKTFSNVVPSGSVPALTQFSEARDKNGVIYYYGGLNGDAQNNMVITMDTRSGTFNILTAMNAPSWRMRHTATMVGTQMYIIGGVDASSLVVDIGNILIYDTLNNNWSSINVSTSATNRFAHTAILGSDGKSIIIFGGSNEYPSHAETLNDVWKLDISSSQPQWTNPSIGGVPPTPGRYCSNAVLVGNQMIVMFGSSANYTYHNDIFVLDTINWEWSTTFIPLSNTSVVPTSASTTSSSTPSSTEGLTGPLQKIGGIGGVVGLACGSLVLFGGVFVYLCFFSRKKKDQPSNARDPQNGWDQFENGRPGFHDAPVPPVQTVPTNSIVNTEPKNSRDNIHGVKGVEAQLNQDLIRQKMNGGDVLEKKPDWEQVEKRNTPDWEQVDKRNVPDWDQMGKRNIPDLEQTEKRNIPDWEQIGKRNTPDWEQAKKRNIPDYDKRL